MKFLIDIYPHDVTVIGACLTVLFLRERAFFLFLVYSYTNTARCRSFTPAKETFVCLNVPVWAKRARARVCAYTYLLFFFYYFFCKGSGRSSLAFNGKHARHFDNCKYGFGSVCASSACRLLLLLFLRSGFCLYVETICIKHVSVNEVKTPSLRPHAVRLLCLCSSRSLIDVTRALTRHFTATTMTIWKLFSEDHKDLL